MIPKTDPEVVKILAKEAEGLLANRAFIQAVKDLRMQWFGELMNDKNDGPKVQELVAKLRALEAIPQLLDHLMTNQQFAQRGQQRA
jgi:hypothetical protein